MEPQPYNDPGDCSPRHREIGPENQPPTENPQPSSKIKIMCSYGGKILPRPLDNRLSYVGGETKILVADRSIKFAPLLAKLNALCNCGCMSFKYQLPGEDLDALVSVTNDDDLEHMVYEYERLYRVSQKSARIRIFFFTDLKQSLILSDRSLVSEERKSEMERFVKALNTPPMVIVPPRSEVSQPQNVMSNADFLFESEKDIAQPENGQLQPEKVQDSPSPIDGRLDPLDQILKNIQDVQWSRLDEPPQGIYMKKNDDYFNGVIPPEKFPPAAVPYWTESKGAFPANIINSDRPIYLIPAPATAYNPPIWRPQTYLAFQRIQPEVYHHPYNPLPQSTTVPDAAAVVTEGGGAFAQVAQDSPVLRQVVYNAPSGVIGAPVQVPVQPAGQYQLVSGGVGTDLQPAGALNPELTAKLVEK